MAKIFLNRSIAKNETCSIRNGATKRLLLIINKTGQDIEYNVPFNGSIGTLEKGNTSFVFINTEKQTDNKILFVFIDNCYGVSLHNEEPIFFAVSTGGYGNSESTVAVCLENTLIEKHSYKNRTESDFVITNKEKGFLEVSLDEAMIMLHSQEIETL